MPFFRKPFKLFAIDADTNQPLDPNVCKKTRVTYYELQNGSNGSKRLVAHKTASEVAKEAETKPAENADADAKPAQEVKKAEGEKADDAVAAWTAEQDKTLKTMKEEGKTWVQISTETGKAKHDCQARWKEIRPAEGVGRDTAKEKRRAKVVTTVTTTSTATTTRKKAIKRTTSTTTATRKKTHPPNLLP
jgi:hypothetical protein